MTIDIRLLHQFVAESNMIENIHRPPLPPEIGATEDFLKLDEITVASLEKLNAALQPGALLRRNVGMDVRVGRYFPPEGGPHIVKDLEAILRDANDMADPFKTHCAYESLHPFMDGNGRTGRALWLWQMYVGTGKLPKLLFLHTFYYQTLQASDQRN